MNNRKQVVLVVMDGVGFRKTGLGDAVSLANTPVLDNLLKTCPNTRLKAHGTAVGLPSDFCRMAMCIQTFHTLL